jgi:hypothetical protein
MAINPGKKIRRITDLGTIIQSVFADIASVIRVAESGLDMAIVGQITAAQRVGPNTTVWFFNSTGGTLYVAFGAAAMAAPTGAADGFPILAGERFALNSGSNSFARASAAGVFAYTGDN